MTGVFAYISDVLTFIELSTLKKGAWKQFSVYYLDVFTLLCYTRDIVKLHNKSLVTVYYLNGLLCSTV
jgi:hypothetical protein